jgi:hypothetical protein
MHIPLEEALTLLGRWRDQQTSLKVHLSCSGLRQDLESRIEDLRGTVVNVSADQPKLEVDLQGADFNGDQSYLVCEFPNGDRCSFRVSRNTVSHS